MAKYRCDICDDKQRWDTLEEALQHMDREHQVPNSRVDVTSIGLERKSKRTTLECGTCYVENGHTHLHSYCTAHGAGL